MEELRPRVQEIADELLDELPATGTVDLMSAYAFLLPVCVICELLGVPAEDRDDFAAWSNAAGRRLRRRATMGAMGKLYGYLSRADRAQARPSPTTR